MENKIVEKFGNRLRVRVSGILIENDALLLVRHSALGEKGILWAPPGGGMKYGRTIEENLKREFLEETALEIAIERFLFLNEYLAPPLHAVELFFQVSRLGGDLTKGIDPEMGRGEQIIQEVGFIPFEELAEMEGIILHQAIRGCHSAEALLERSGYIKFGSSA